MLQLSSAAVQWLRAARRCHDSAPCLRTRGLRGQQRGAAAQGAARFHRWWPGRVGGGVKCVLGQASVRCSSLGCLLAERCVSVWGIWGAGARRAVRTACARGTGGHPGACSFLYGGAREGGAPASHVLVNTAALLSVVRVRICIIVARISMRHTMCDGAAGAAARARALVGAANRTVALLPPGGSFLVRWLAVPSTVSGHELCVARQAPLLPPCYQLYPLGVTQTGLRHSGLWGVWGCRVCDALPPRTGVHCFVNTWYTK